MIGDRVKQARLLARLTQQGFADQLGAHGYQITKAAISKYENHKSVPSAQFLLVATRVLDVPSTYFTYEPSAEVKWLAFRRHSQLPQKEQDVVKAYATDIVELQIELQTLLYPNTKPDLPSTKVVTTFEQAEEAAMRLRQQWELDNYPIDSLVQTAEDRQVIVIGWNRNDGKLDGLSGWCNNHPVTVININVDIDRRRFSLAHELGHLMMNTSDVSDKEEEKLANRFASAFLVPADRAYHELGTRRTQLDLGELGILKRKYSLSMAAWIYRAKDLGIITQHHAGLLYKEMSYRGWKKAEPTQYIGDEEPIQLHQMARHAVAEGLMNPDRIKQVCADCLELDPIPTNEEHLTVYDLLSMADNQRETVIDRAFALASNDNFEILEAFDDEDFNDAAF